MAKPDTLEFLVQGSAPEPYQILFFRSGAELRAHCDCDAGRNWLHCKHRLRILTGSAEGIVSPNAGDIPTVLSWLPGTTLERQLSEIAAIEHQAAALKSQLSKAKKILGQIMGLD
jgi:hypothetical protein